MKVSELWLRNFVAPPLSADELADQLTHAGIEIDGVEWTEEPKQAIWTLKIPPNRGDCLSMEGIAREVALLNQLPYKAIPTVDPVVKILDTFPLQVKSPQSCPRYFGCVIENVQANVATPAWLKSRLEMAGIRSVLAIVDIMNYVMLELGQPFHAFDLAKLDTELVIRDSKAGEKIVLLDGQEIELKANTLVIADKSKVQAIAGVMGGALSAVNETTTSIFIECAYFDPVAIRLSAKQYSLKTDASYRFERGIDPQLQERALARAIELVLEIAGGRVGPIIKQEQKSLLTSPSAILLKRQKIERLLGRSFTDNEVREILKNSVEGIEIEQEDAFRIFPPSYRQDLILDVDLIEEIARVYGYHRFKSVPLAGACHSFSISETKVPTSLIRQTLVSRGFNEIITYSFVDIKLMKLLDPTLEPLLLTNPISSEMAAMRLNLWPGLLQTVQYNQRRQQWRARLFELGNCYMEQEGKMIEKEVLAGVCVGSLYPEQWGVSSKPHDFYDVKKEIENLLMLGDNQSVIFEKAEHIALHPGQTAKIIRKGETMGYLGALHPRIIKALELEGPIYVFELDVVPLQKAIKPEFYPLSKFPIIRRDLAILVQKNVFAEELRSAIEKCAGQYLKKIAIFDVYEGKGIEPNKKSIALGLILQHPSRTLVEGEVNSIVEEVVTMLFNRFQATLRE